MYFSFLFVSWFLLFFQEGEFLVLPSSIKLDGTKLLLDEAFGVSSANEARKHGVSGSLHTNDKSTVLKLNSQKGKFILKDNQNQSKHQSQI